jgi:hypothetical protein
MVAANFPDSDLAYAPVFVKYLESFHPRVIWNDAIHDSEPASLPGEIQGTKDLLTDDGAG